MQSLWRQADQVRREHVGEAVHFRGLIEISNYCSRECWYCGLRAPRKGIERYRMSDEEILDCVNQAKEFQYGTVVLQGGEDLGISPDRIAALVKKIKTETPLSVTLSLGEQAPEVFQAWRTAGADRYLLRIETTDPELIKRIHPGEPHGSRMSNIDTLRSMGYEVGSGIMVGIPGQTYSGLVEDLIWFRDMDLDMIGIGPYLPHPDTPLSNPKWSAGRDQVPNHAVMVYKSVALARLLCPEANLPATTALATLNRLDGREQALNYGANVVMPNLTPVHYRKLYEIYPDKVCIEETGAMCHQCLGGRIRKLGREIGRGSGKRMKAFK